MTVGSSYLIVWGPQYASLIDSRIMEFFTEVCRSSFEYKNFAILPDTARCDRASEQLESLGPSGF